MDKIAGIYLMLNVISVLVIWYLNTHRYKLLHS
jgi:hypothetical protein